MRHIIPFMVCVINWGLTPDWLDHLDNLVLAHKGACNHQIEVQDMNIPEALAKLGIDVSESCVIRGGYYTL